VQQRSLSRIVQTQEQKFGMLVEETEGGEYVVDCKGKHQCKSSDSESGKPVMRKF
jgi:hypothetical protein